MHDGNFKFLIHFGSAGPIREGLPIRRRAARIVLWVCCRRTAAVRRTRPGNRAVQLYSGWTRIHPTRQRTRRRKDARATRRWRRRLHDRAGYLCEN